VARIDLPTVARMSALGREGSRRQATMVCPDCDVTWRGCESDSCWSCGESGQVHEATPRRVRLTPAGVDADRLVG